MSNHHYFSNAEYKAELAVKAREKNRLRLAPLIVEDLYLKASSLIMLVKQ